MTNDGGPAFPRSSGYIPHGEVDCHAEQEGLTLRQWYAGMALIGCRLSDNQGQREENARLAFAQADAMIAHEEKEKA